MEYNLKVMNKIYLMRLYGEAYRKKYNLTEEEFLKLDSKKKILRSILDLSYDLDSLPVEEGMKDLEAYINDNDQENKG